MYWIFFFALCAGVASAIDCYTCASMAGSDRRCEDPVYKEFLNYTNNCQVPIKVAVNGSLKSDMYHGIVATEPATHCVKTIGVTQNKREQLVIRSCVDRDMNSQCGTFIFRNQSVRGCMLTCSSDLCNASLALLGNTILIGLLAIGMILHIQSR